MSVRLAMRTKSEEILKKLQELDLMEKRLEETKKAELKENEKLKSEKKVKQDEVKKNICDNIKENVKKSSNMSLIQEEILEDGSVVLTIST